MTDLLSDGDGLRQALDWNGASSMRPCLKHANVLMKGSGLVDLDSNFVEITSYEYQKFQRSTAEDHALEVDTTCAALREVEAGRMTKDKYKTICKAMGVHANPLGIAACPWLRKFIDLTQISMYDWVHTQLQDGVLSCDTYLLLKACERIGVQMSTFEAYLKRGWEFPNESRPKAMTLYRCFNEYRSRAVERADKLKCTASELLGVYGLIRHYVETEIPEADLAEISKERMSFDAACKVVDILILSKRHIVDVNAAGSLLRELKSSQNWVSGILSTPSNKYPSAQ